MGQQTLVITLDEVVTRRIRFHLDQTASGYESISEFLTIAAMNLLELEANTVSAGAPQSPRAAPTLKTDSLLARLPASAPLELTRVRAPKDEALFVLTNRLAPVKIAARVLANLGARAGWPEVMEFHERASEVARQLGKALRQADQAEGRAGHQRRWIAFPTGENERAAAGRFISSFTIADADGEASGPLAVLGLADVVDGRAVLTEAGWMLAAEPSPILGEAPGDTMSDGEATILRRQLLTAEAELASIREFLELATRAAGLQSRIDELLAVRHHNWSVSLATSHRSAMIGRLREVQALAASGRGPEARVEILAAAEEFTTRDGEDKP